MAHPKLQELFGEAIRVFDHKILETYRNQERQNYLCRIKKSKVLFPASRHNQMPSMAVDAAPYPIDWTDERRFILFAGVVKGLAHSMSIPIRWGGDWDGDTQLKDNRFNDYCHFELLLK
jgi:peptidoglycan L-alanyl-D-glutamate endopeptidase CwlK